VSDQRGRSSIGQEGGRNDTDLAASLTVEDCDDQRGVSSASERRARGMGLTFSDGFDLGIVKGVGRRVLVHSESVDSGLVSGHDGGGRVGRVGNETASFDVVAVSTRRDEWDV